MLKDMFLGRIDYVILEVSKDATEKQIELLKKMHPNSIVVIERSLEEGKNEKRDIV